MKSPMKPSGMISRSGENSLRLVPSSLAKEARFILRVKLSIQPGIKLMELRVTKRKSMLIRCSFLAGRGILCDYQDTKPNYSPDYPKNI